MSMKASERQAKEALTSQDRRADEDFRRTNQRVAYAEFLSAVLQMSKSLSDLQAQMVGDQAHLPSGEDLKNAVVAIKDLVAKINEKFSAVEIVGSAETSEAARAWLAKLIEVLTGLQSCLEFKPDQTLVHQDKARGLANGIIKAGELQAKYLQVARKDVSAYG